MDLAYLMKLLYYSGLIIWILPAIRQFRRSFFFYFVILALADPIFLIHTNFLDAYGSLYLGLIINYFLLLSVFSQNEIYKNKTILILILVLSIFLTALGNNYKITYSIIVIFRIAIFVKFLIVFFQKQIDEKLISAFYIVLLLYELTNIFKFSNLVFGITDATAYFFITGFFQITIGVYFSIFREDNPKAILNQP